MTRHYSADDTEREAVPRASRSAKEAHRKPGISSSVAAEATKKASWTPEPWTTNAANQHTEILGFTDPQSVDFVAETNGDVVWAKSKLTARGIAQGQANAARIVACVNACAGLNPAAYREVVEALKAATKELKGFESAVECDPNCPEEKAGWAILIDKCEQAIALAQAQP